MPRNPNKTPCSTPGCRAWAIRGSDPPLCSPHSNRKTGAPPGNQNRLVHGFYASVLKHSDRTEDAADTAGTSLDAEIAIVRVALRRILGMLLTGATIGPDPRPLTVHEIARYAGLAFQGAGTVSRLLRARRALTGQNDPLDDLMNQTLDILSEQWGIPL